MKRDYEFLTVLGVGGINEQDGLADPIRELSAARNVWAPDGHIESRPGYRGVMAFAPSYTVQPAAGTTVVKESAGVFSDTLTLTGLAVATSSANDYYYLIGPLFTSATGTSQQFGLRMNISAANSAAVVPIFEYWNGTQWYPLQVTETETANDILSSTHLDDIADGYTNLWFAGPQDAASTTINGHAGSAIRVHFLSVNGSTVLTGGPVLVDFRKLLSIATLSPPTRAAYLIAQFPYMKRYIGVYPLNVATGGAKYRNCSNFFAPISAAEVITTTTPPYQVDEPASYALVTQFGEAYVSYNYNVSVHKVAPTAADNTVPQVENDPAFVGPDGDYNPVEVPQAATWPQAKYITFFRGEFWAANLKDGGFYTVKWSAPSPAYKVWPTLNEEILMEDDNSPITGLCGYDQYMVVFKEDSVWRMVDTGISDFSLQTYAPERVVAGVGCVCNGSVQQIRGRLVFLAEDGIYAYDGTPNIQKLSDRIYKTIGRINPSQRASASSVNWTTKSLYLLAVAVDGAAVNNAVLVWDYKNDAWWIWDNIEAQQFFADEDGADNQRIYFADRYGRMYELGANTTDHGVAIAAYYETQRLDEGPFTRKLREVEVLGTNLTGSMTVEVLKDDATTGTGASGTMTFSDTAEDVYNTAVYSTDTYTAERIRAKRVGFMEAARSFKVRFSHALKGIWKVHRAAVGIITMGRRR